MKIATLRGNIKQNLRYHLADSTSMQGIFTPIAATFETFVAGMSNENSMNARLLGIGLTYAGMGRLYSKGLDTSRKLFHIGAETKERIKQIHDTAYSAVYCLTTTPPFYYAAGVRDLKQIVIGTAASAGLGLIMGGPAGWAIDVFRDLTGLKETERLPKFIKRQNKNLKRGLAALLVAGCLGTTAAVYEAHSYFKNNNNPASERKDVELINLLAQSARIQGQ